MERELLKRAVKELVLDALWECPMIVREADGDTVLDEETVKEWTQKIDDLFRRAETDTWLPEER